MRWLSWRKKRHEDDARRLDSARKADQQVPCAQELRRPRKSRAGKSRAEREQRAGKSRAEREHEKETPLRGGVKKEIRRKREASLLLQKAFI